MSSGRRVTIYDCWARTCDRSVVPPAFRARANTGGCRMPCKEDALPRAVLRVLRGSEDCSRRLCGRALGDALGVPGQISGWFSSHGDGEKTTWLEALPQGRPPFLPLNGAELRSRPFCSCTVKAFSSSSSKELEPSYLGQNAQGKILWLPADDPRREASVEGCRCLCFAIESSAGKGAVTAGILRQVASLRQPGPE